MFRPKNGSFANFASNIPVATSPSAPKINGTKVRNESHGCWDPPQEIAIKKDVDDEIKRKPPSQSTRASLVPRDSVRGFKVSTNGMVAKAMPMNGNMM